MGARHGEMLNVSNALMTTSSMIIKFAVKLLPRAKSTIGGLAFARNATLDMSYIVDNASWKKFLTPLLWAAKGSKMISVWNVRPGGFLGKMGIVRKWTIYVENGIKILEIAQIAILVIVSMMANALKIAWGLWAQLMPFASNGTAEPAFNVQKELTLDRLASAFLSMIIAELGISLMDFALLVTSAIHFKMEVVLLPKIVLPVCLILVAVGGIGTLTNA